MKINKLDFDEIEIVSVTIKKYPVANKSFITGLILKCSNSANKLSVELALSELDIYNLFSVKNKINDQVEMVSKFNKQIINLLAECGLFSLPEENKTNPEEELKYKSQLIGIGRDND